MVFYFQLQAKRIFRSLNDFGINPVAGIIIIAILFTVMSVFFFSKVPYANYFYATIAFASSIKSGDTVRNQFLKSFFNENTFKILRVIENTIIVLPALFFLLFKMCFFTALILFIAVILASAFSFNTTTNVTLPTPFYKNPFEFIIGFRRFFLIIILTYILCVIAVAVDNFNLAIATLAIVFLVCISFYIKQDDKFYIWIFSLTKNKFIIRKITLAVLNSFLLSLPILVALIVFYSFNIFIILEVQLLGTLFLTAIIAAKYAAFPAEINLPQVIVFAVCLMLPPLIILALPYFYLQAIKKLTPILG